MIVGLPTDRIPVAGPWITDLEVRYVSEAAQHDWYANAAASVGRFERAFAEYVGVGFGVAVPHCTSALHLSLLSLGVGPGDEVIVPDITWVATAAPIFYVGATPVYADIDRQTWCVSAETIEACITPRTKAVITVDLYGAVPDMDAIRDVARRHGIAIVEDAAEAAGGEWKGAKAGSLGDLGTFSFHGSKTLTCGEGGMLVTDDPELHRRIASLRDHGRSPDGFKYFVTQEVGYKYRMSSLQAAFGLAQLERLDELIQRKRDIFRWYSERLADRADLQLNWEEPGSLNTYWMVCVVLDHSLGLTGREVMDALELRKIESRPFFHPLSTLPAFADRPGAAQARSNVTARDISPRAINLPSALLLTESHVDRVCESLLHIIDRRQES